MFGDMTWYESLTKPGWTPAPSTIGTIWSVLYPLIAVVFGYIIFRVLRQTIPAAVLVPVAINVVSNLAFTPIQFGLKSLPLASVDILVVLASIVWCMIVFWPHSRFAALALTPYLAWVATATTLQLSITWLNR